MLDLVEKTTALKEECRSKDMVIAKLSRTTENLISKKTLPKKQLFGIQYQSYRLIHMEFKKKWQNPQTPSSQK